MNSDQINSIFGELKHIFAKEMNSDIAELILDHFGPLDCMRMLDGSSFLALAEKAVLRNKDYVTCAIVNIDRGQFLEEVASTGNIILIVWAFANKIRIYDNLLLTAIRNNQFELSRYLVQVVMINHPYACVHAASLGRLDILKMLVNSRFNCSGVAIEAAKGGHLDVLCWILRGQIDGKKIDIVWYHAIKNGYIHILEWLHNNGYHPINKVREHGSPEVDAWLIANGY